MTIQRNLVILCILAVTTLLVSNSAAQKKGNKYACSEEQPEKLCNASNTCGSPSSPCNLDVKRTANSASVTPDIPNAKGNSLFCIKVGTTVNWKSTGKNIGFLIDFGPDSPFEPADAISGGYSSPASVVAKKAGCYKYSAGACAAGGIYGMCKDTSAEAIVIN
jgi:hypothetical protein